MEKYFNDIFIKFEKKLLNNKKFFGTFHYSYEICQSFKGIIPDEIRNKITNIKKNKEFKKIILITESNGWEEIYNENPISGINASLNLDPLIVGFDKSGNSYLIDFFDLTTLEKTVKGEFTE